MASVGTSPSATTRWNESTAVFVAYRMLMIERKPIARVVQFLNNIESLVGSDGQPRA